MADVTVVIDQAAYNRFISWQGPIGRDFNRRLRTLEFRARNSAGISTPTPTSTGVPGALRVSIHTERKPISPEGLSARVGSDRPYALWHHQGTGVHGGKGRYPIVPRRKGGRLRFWWAKIGAIVYAKRVMHPGSRPNPYLTRWLREAVR
jgi:hypothetical protein